MRPFRSVLYMPGSNPRALEKAKSLAADALILDLEDAVAPDSKVAARDQIVTAVNGGGYGQRYLIVRINGFDTEWGAGDLEAIAACKPHAVLLPKTGSRQDIERLNAAMDGFPGYADTKIWAMMETPAGILHADAIAGSGGRLEGLVMGTNDLVKDLGARATPDRAAVAGSLTQCLLAARSHGLVIVDGVWNALRDVDGLTAESTAGRVLGFDGKTLIHPNQIEAANDAFSPTDAELTEAHAFVEGFEAAIAEGKAVAVVDGRIVENLHVEAARRLIAQADAIAAMGAA